jgi:hypothetical protein
MATLFLKPQISIFHRLAATGPKSNSKAQIGIGFDSCLIKTSRTAFSNDSLQRVKSKRNELLLF